MDECLEAIVAERFEKKHLRLSAGIAGAEQTSTQHARGVHGDGVAWRDKLDDVVEPPVLDGTGSAIDHHEPALVAPVGGDLRDPVGRQGEVVVGGARTGGRGVPRDRRSHSR